MDKTPPLLELCEVSKRFAQATDFADRIVRRLRRQEAQAAQAVLAVDCVSLSIRRGEVVGLVGESGSGKSTLGRIAAGLHAPSSGTRRWKGEALDALRAGERRRKQLGIQMIFQDPYASLNPRLRVQDIVGEAPVAHGLIAAKQQAEYAADLLQRVGLDAALARRFPHQFSGGQRARIGIARALAVQPELLICDEAVAALDVSIQAQVLNLFMQLRDELQLTYLFISHDLGVVRHIADRVLVMYLGRIVEAASTEDLFARPQHPYTVALLEAAPTLAVKKIDFHPLQGEMPSPLRPPSACAFHTRCPHAMPVCAERVPELKEVAPGHFSACHLDDQA
ncbi:MAG TPA: ABC transporter ATP-binding protein [Oxalicibacterium sp.]|nr:ABC transporter ATP-binding protein [Oxalicibacterium sp.]